MVSVVVTAPSVGRRRGPTGRNGRIRVHVADHGPGGEGHGRVGSLCATASAPTVVSLPLSRASAYRPARQTDIVERVRGGFVGRDRELAALADCLVAAQQGHPGIVLCRGEPGIGKTRLAEELVALAGQRHVPALWGVGVESEGAPPYWPWREILRGAADLVAVGNVDPDLARLAPEVFGGPESTPESTAGAEARFRQFEAVARLLRRITGRTALVVILDDAHWADRPSVLLLRHLARTLRDERLLVMVSHRDTEHEHAAEFAELLREPIAQQIDLTGLTVADVAVHLASVVGHDVNPSDAAQVHALTRGNPFFVGEVARVLPAGKVAGGLAPVTANVREAIGSRLGRLSPVAVRLIHAASIVGREFSTTIAAPMVGLSSVSCLAALDEAAFAGLVVPGAVPGSYGFRHALVRDAIEAGLSTAERVRLHRAAAETIESGLRRTNRAALVRSRASLGGRRG